MSPQGYKNMDLESQDPIFNANLGQDENLIWTKKLRCSHSKKALQRLWGKIEMLRNVMALHYNVYHGSSELKAA